MKNWIKNNNKYVEFWAWMATMIVILLFMSSCTSIKVLPINTPPEEPTYEMEEFQRHYEYCEQFMYDGETWMECITDQVIRTRLA